MCACGRSLTDKQPASTDKRPEQLTALHQGASDGCNKSGRCLPGRAGSYAEAHVSLLGEGVIPQLLEVLRPQVFVRVPGHGILT